MNIITLIKLAKVRFTRGGGGCTTSAIRIFLFPECVNFAKKHNGTGQHSPGTRRGTIMQIAGTKRGYGDERKRLATDAIFSFMFKFFFLLGEAEVGEVKNGTGSFMRQLHG
jgi:hypothetical protein